MDKSQQLIWLHYQQLSNYQPINVLWFSMEAKNPEQKSIGLCSHTPPLIAHWELLHLLSAGLLLTATDSERNHVNGTHIDFIQRGENPLTQQPVFVVYTDKGKFSNIAPSDSKQLMDGYPMHNTHRHHQPSLISWPLPDGRKTNRKLIRNFV